MPVWTAQQQEVISSDSRRIICSAAAGSGKTAVMIERIVRMLREGADPESFLVVTFTNAAAAEMKQKIRDRLRAGRSEKNLRRALEKIDLMEISTIHSFCQRLIRQDMQLWPGQPLHSLLFRLPGLRHGQMFCHPFPFFQHEAAYIRRGHPSRGTHQQHPRLLNLQRQRFPV